MGHMCLYHTTEAKRIKSRLATRHGDPFPARGVLATVRPFNHQEADNDHKTDRSHRSNMVPNAGCMGAAAILSERQDRMTLLF